MNLAALTDHPSVPRCLQQVRFNPEREWMLFDHDLIIRQSRHGHQSEICPPHGPLPVPRGLRGATRLSGAAISTLAAGSFRRLPVPRHPLRLDLCGRHSGGILCGSGALSRGEFTCRSRDALMGRILGNQWLAEFEYSAGHPQQSAILGRRDNAARPRFRSRPWARPRS